MKHALAFAFLLVAASCGSKKPAPTEPAGGSAASGSAMGSDMGSGMASGSAMGSDMGSGSAMGSDMGSGAASGAGSATEPPPPPPPPAPVGFEALDHAAKIKVMKQHVIPEMGKEMTKFDKKRWKKVECKTCHGKSAEDGTFKMPNPDLPKLDESWFGDNPPADKKAILQFMEETMKPHMAKILELPEFDPKNPSAGGFGCLNCHTMGGK